MIPVKFRKTAAPLVTADYTEFVTGKPKKNFYMLNSSYSYYLSEAVVYSDTIQTGSTPLKSAGYTKVLTLTADIGFDRARVIDGQVIVQVPFAIGYTGATGTTNEGYVNISLHEYDGAAATSFACSERSRPVRQESGITAPTTTVLNVPIDVTNQKIKAGNDLRIVIDAWGETSDNNLGQIYIAHDPTDRTGLNPWFDGVNDTTQLVITSPFKATF